MYYTSLDRSRKRSHTSKIAFYDTNSPELLMKQHARLTKTTVKDHNKLKYDETVLKLFIAATNPEDAYDWIYFPFYIDKQHWIRVCLDISAFTVQLLDCNCGFRTESMTRKDLNPITIVVPHIMSTTLFSFKHLNVVVLFS